MIYVERDGMDDAGEVIRPDDAWFQLAGNATATAIAEQNKHEANKAIYAHTKVKKALERLFHDKCAYCESKMTATADWDVEHFRPKGRVAERENHPGYYWLTYVWENLYPSCQHCNQRRKDRPRWEDPTELPAGGKVDQFPLLDESTRAMGPADDVHAEHTLLIDPCFDDPEDYLGYDPTGQIFSLNDNPSGERTIDVFHLSRRRLRDFRRETVVAVRSVLKLIANGAIAANASAANDLNAFLENMQAGKSQHAGLARYVAKHPAEFGV
ncbi:MAG: TIGR02646 family protein [Phycisphaerales bacterium]|nr:MAG: TIGR02646 family protein [Phycisphaerales bacterium]